MDLGLKGTKAIITGATKGIGRAIAESLTDEGASVAICSRNADEVKKAVSELGAKGVKVVGDAVDIGDGDAYKAWLAKAADELGGCDVFVANVSGGNAPGEQGWRNNFEFDVLGTVRGVEVLQPHLEKSGKGNIVVISTTAALEHFLGAGPYGAMKAGLINYASALAVDLAPKGIRVNTVSPGPIFIEGGAWNYIKDNMTPLYEKILGEIPMGRMGKAQEVADQVAFLVSPRGGFTSGANIVIDGAFTKRVQF
ncbi:MAG: SDR family oxidoreductase [Gammaproteobacteria bacterium]|nr:SDR family oxidoreductase [Gammaproteobacteria bacterium]